MLSSFLVSYAAGLPLALKVVGSFLYDKTNEEWRAYLDELKKFPNDDVMNILMTSYEGLEDYQKELFLDIACFLRGAKKHNYMDTLDAFGFRPVIGIKVLQQKALITIVDGKFDMHNLIQEMGHHIVRRKDPYNPEEHSRVWKKKEIDSMFFEDETMDNDKIEALTYWSPSSRLFKIVSTMKKLRWLRMGVTRSVFDDDDDSDKEDDKHLTGPEFLPNELRCIEWCMYPAESFPDSFKATKLVVLHLEFRMQKQLWNDKKLRLPNLKVLQLLFMKKLLNTPNFDHLPCLQTLTLYECNELIEIHPSLGNNRKLEHICVEFCQKLTMFPVIKQTRTLKTLTVEQCQQMFEFPEFLGEMESLESLESLSLISIPIEVQPSHQLSHSLRKLDLKCWDFKYLFDIGDLSNLQRLNLSGGGFSQLPFSLSQLTQLKIFNVNFCLNLKNLPQFPSSLAVFKANECYNLKALGSCITDCKGLSHVQIVGGRSSILTDGDRLYKSMFQGKDIENRCMRLKLKGLEIPKSIVPHILNGNRCTLQLPQNWFNYYCGFLMCAVLTDAAFPRHLHNHNDSALNNVEITMKQVTDSSTGMDYQDDAVWEESYYDTKSSVRYVPFGSLRHTSWWDVTYNQVSFEIDCRSFNKNFPGCSAFGVILIPRKSENSSSEPSTDSSKFSDDDYTPKIDIQQDSKYALVYRFSAPYLN